MGRKYTIEGRTVSVRTFPPLLNPYTSINNMKSETRTSGAATTRRTRTTTTAKPARKKAKAKAKPKVVKKYDTKARLYATAAKARKSSAKANYDALAEKGKLNLCKADKAGKDSNAARLAKYLFGIIAGNPDATEINAAKQIAKDVRKFTVEIGKESLSKHAANIEKGEIELSFSVSMPGNIMKKNGLRQVVTQRMVKKGLNKSDLIKTLQLTPSQMLKA